jgi:uncharacterized membrane protein YdjX (TVP38/TMEM64 family)
MAQSTESQLGSLFKKLGPAGPMAIIATTLPALGGFLILASLEPARNWLESFGDRAIWIYVGGFAFAAGLALLPTYSLAVLGGWVFGVEHGFLGAIGGFTIGSAIGYVTGSLAGGARVERILSEQPKWKAVRDAILGEGKGVSSLKTLGIVSLLRLPPNSPFALTNLVLSSLRVPFFIYIIATAIGMAPRTYLVALAASKVKAATELDGAGKGVMTIVISFALFFAIFMILNHMARRALDRMTNSVS